MAYNNSLKALAELKTDGVQKMTQFKVDPRILQVEAGFNVRTEGADLNAHVDSLKLAIKAGANIPAMDVRVDNGSIIIVDGHCRLRAVMELISEGAEIESVEVRQYRGNDAERVAHMLTSAQGKALTPLELALSYKRLVAFGWDAKAISARVGKSLSHVEQMIILSQSNTDVQQMVANGEVPAHVAVKQIRKHGEKTGEMLAEMLVDAKANGKTKVTKAVTESNPAAADKKKKAAIPDVAPMTMSECISKDYMSGWNDCLLAMQGKL